MQLALDIEMLTASSWTQHQRDEVAELIRTYRFGQVSGALLKVQKFLIASGNSELSEKIFLGRI